MSIVKKAGLEASGVVDSVTNLPINVSTTARMLYRHWFKGQEKGGGSYSRVNWSGFRNKELNNLIAQDFQASGSGVSHLFPCKHESCTANEMIEVRLIKSAIGGKQNPFNYFFSVRRTESIDIIALTGRYMKPNKPRL